MYAQVREEIRENRTIRREIDARFGGPALARPPLVAKPEMLLTHAHSSETLADEPTEFANGVVFEYYPGEYALLPDFEALTPACTSVWPSLELDSASEQALLQQSLPETSAGDRSILDMGNYAARLSGFLDVPADAHVTLFLTSNDGSALYLGGRQLISNDGTHYAVERSGSASLTAGRYPVTILYFHRNGKLLEGLRSGAQLSVSFSLDGSAPAPLPGGALWYRQDDPRLVGFPGVAEPADVLAVPHDAALAGEPRVQQLQRALVEQQRQFEAERVELVRQLDDERARTSRLEAALATLELFAPAEPAPPPVDRDERLAAVAARALDDVARLKQLYFLSTGLSVKMAQASAPSSRPTPPAPKRPSGGFWDYFSRRKPSTGTVVVHRRRSASTAPSSSALVQVPKVRNVDLHELYGDILAHNVPLEDWGRVLGHVFAMARAEPLDPAV